MISPFPRGAGLRPAATWCPIGRMDDVVVYRGHVSPALEAVSYLRAQGLDAIILEETESDSLHGGHVLKVGVPDDEAVRARELLAARDTERERDVSALLRAMRGQVSLGAMLTVLIVGGHAMSVGGWSWGHLGAAPWVFVGVLAAMGLVQRVADRRP